MPENKKTQEDEVRQLRARIKELEAELSRKEKKKESKGSKFTEKCKDVDNRTIDEVSKLFRGFTLAFLEELRLATNVMNSFTNKVFQSNRPKEKTSPRDLAKELPKEIYDGFLDVINETLDIPSKGIDKFYESYKEVD